MFVEDFSGQMPELPALLSEILGEILTPPAVELACAKQGECFSPPCTNTHKWS